MICVYPADCTDFSTNGNGTLAPLSAEVTEARSAGFPESTLKSQANKAAGLQSGSYEPDCMPVFFDSAIVDSKF